MFKKTKKPPVNQRRAAKSGGRAPVFSYYGNRAGSESPKTAGKTAQSSFPWQLVPSLIALAVIACSLVYASTLDTNPRLTIEKTGSQALLQDEAVYTEAAQKYLKESLFNRSKLLIHTKPIEDQLLADFPELKTAGVTIPLTSRRPIVVVKAAEARLLLVTPDGNYVIDSQGRAVRQTADTGLAGSLDLPVVTDESGIKPALGKVTLSAREAAFISELHHQLEAKAVQVESLTLPPLVNELHLRLKGQGYFVKFNLLGDARQQTGSFLAVQEELAQNGSRPSAYIDVRVDEKAFYQ